MKGRIVREKFLVPLQTVHPYSVQDTLVLCDISALVQDAKKFVEEPYLIVKVIQVMLCDLQDPCRLERLHIGLGRRIVDKALEVGASRWTRNARVGKWYQAG